MTSVFTPDVVFTILQHASNVCVSNTRISFIHTTYTGHHVYNSNDILKLHSDFQFEFIMNTSS